MNLPEVNIVERVTELMGEFPSIRYDGEITYSFNAGYERLIMRRQPDYGSSNYEGTYHPNVVCEGGGVCKWCGRVIEYDSY